MKLKTFVARDTQEALAQVKRELGPEAVILSTQSRHLHAAGSRRSAQRQVEVTAVVPQGISFDALADCRLWSMESPGIPDLSASRLKEELQDLKALVKQWLWEHGPPAWLAPYENLVPLFKTMVRVGIHDQIIRRWLEKVRILVNNGKNERRKNFGELGILYLMEEMAVVDPWKAIASGLRRWTFLGPTGVGKTTTVVKLAIQAAFMKKKKVGLISLDNVRPGGQDQLAAYARISELPFCTVQSRQELSEALERMSGLDLVLIDTPGRNPCDPALPQELYRLVGEVPGLEHHLVVSATATEANLADALRGFRLEPQASCIVTKVDEVRDIVGVFNQLGIHRLPVSLISTGQRIPEDLEPANHRRLAGFLLKHRNPIKIAR